MIVFVGPESDHTTPRIALSVTKFQPHHTHMQHRQALWIHASRILLVPYIFLHTKIKRITIYNFFFCCCIFFLDVSGTPAFMFFLLQIIIEGDDARNLGELVSQVSLVLVF